MLAYYKMPSLGKAGPWVLAGPRKSLGLYLFKERVRVLAERIEFER